MLTKRYFEILEISPTKDEKVIKKAYRKLALKYHPDKNDTDEAHQRFIQISEAYENLLLAIEHANKSPEERAEYVNRSKAKGPQKRAKTAEELYEERLKEARRRYEEMRQKEEQENEAYYQKISSGFHWKLFRGVMVGCLLFAFLFLLDHSFLPSRWEKSEIRKENRQIKHGGIKYRKIAPVQLATGDKLWVQPAYSASMAGFGTVYIERSFFFRDIKRLWTWEAGEWNTNVGDFSVQGTFPLVPLFLIIPFVTFLIKGRTLTFSLLFNISLYMYGIILITLLISNDRWAHLITLGFF